MTRDEFMEHARKEIDQAFQGQKNRMMNLISQAWAEGKKNAETSEIEEKATDILEALRKQISDAAEASKLYVDAPKITKMIICSRNTAIYNYDIFYDTATNYEARIAKIKENQLQDVHYGKLSFLGLRK